MITGVPVRRRSDRRDRDPDRRGVVAGAEDQRLHARRGGRDRLAGQQPGRVLDLRLDADPADGEPLRELDLGQQLVGHLDVAGRADLRHHDRIELRARALDDRDQVLVVVRRVGAVDAHDDRLGTEVQRVQRLDDPFARRVLLVRRDRVLEVEEDLVRLQPYGLGDEALAGPGHGVARAA